jgi:hypothetical protein
MTRYPAISVMLTARLGQVSLVRGIA